MRRIDLVPPVHVPRAEEGIGIAAPEVFALVGARVRPQQRRFGDVFPNSKDKRDSTASSAGPAQAP